MIADHAVIPMRPRYPQLPQWSLGTAARRRETLLMPRAPRIPDVLAHGPFLGSVALRTGLLTRAQLHSATWRYMFRDVYVNARLPESPELRMKAIALKLPPGAAITGRSAAHLWGAHLTNPGDDIEVLTPTRLSIRGVTTRTGLIAGDETTTLQAIPLTTPHHTAFEIARSLPLLGAIAWIDALARAQHISTASLVAHVTRHEGEPGSRIAQSVLSKADPRAESPPESQVRVQLHDAGMTFIPQWNIVHNGFFIARVDLALPALKLAVEYDGQWHADPHQLARDRARLRALNAAGWYVYPITAADTRNMPSLIADLRRVIARRSAIMESRSR